MHQTASQIPAQDDNTQQAAPQVEMLPCSATLALPTHPLFLEVLFEEILRDFSPREVVRHSQDAA